VTVSDIAL